MKPFRPMRPGISLNRQGLVELLPVLANSHFVFQVKLNDERGVMTADGKLFNRHGSPLDPAKVAAFAPAIAEIRRALPNEPLDLALLGYRTDAPSWKGRVVLLDRPGHLHHDCNYLARMGMFFNIFCWNPLKDTAPPRVSALPTIMPEDALKAFDLAFTRRPWLEGLVGRANNRPYEFGESPWMVKVKELV